MAGLQGVEILHLDAELIAVNKNAGVLSIPGRDPDELSLLGMLRTQFEEVLPVHRLDRDTSGVILFARNQDCHRNLSIQFERHEIRKTYQAIVTGRPVEDQFEVDLPLTLNNKNLMQPDKQGKPSVTVFSVLERYGRYSLVQAEPKTGRQHQIRAHLRAVGNPLAIDPAYGEDHALGIGDIKSGANLSGSGKATTLLSRTPLHAAGIEFLHPASGVRMSIEAPLPKDMRALLNQLRKWGG